MQTRNSALSYEEFRGSVPFLTRGLPEPSSLRGSTLGTSPVEHQDSDWV